LALLLFSPGPLTFMLLTPPLPCYHHLLLLITVPAAHTDGPEGEQAS
jgi:hypothetical protein